VRPGDTVLCLGTGGVSMLAAQFAVAAGARAIVTSSSDEKLQRALKALGAHGAAEGVNYKKSPDWDREVARLTNGRGADCIIEIGGAGTLERSYRSLAFEGKIMLIGFLGGPEGETNPFPLMMKGGSLIGIGVGSTRMFEDMNRAIEVNRIQPVIDKVFPFEQAAEAFRHMASGTFVGKVVITV
jgi:NADPH:quinone reductase-like Zn-dependent oxidoreductase